MHLKPSNLCNFILEFKNCTFIMTTSWIELLPKKTDQVLSSCRIHFFLIFSSPDPVPPTMLFLFLFGSLDKHLLHESDKPCPKPHRDLQPKATNWGRPQVSAQAGLHQGRIVFHVFWLKLVKMKLYTSPGYQTLQSKPLRQKKNTFPLSRRARISPTETACLFRFLRSSLRDSWISFTTKAKHLK